MLGRRRRGGSCGIGEFYVLIFFSHSVVGEIVFLLPTVSGSVWFSRFGFWIGYLGGWWGCFWVLLFSFLSFVLCFSCR